MRTAMLVLVTVLALGSVPAASVNGAETQDTITQPATAIPVLKQAIGLKDTFMGATRYPTFTKAEPMYDMDYACRDFLMTKPGINNAKLPKNLIAQDDFEAVDGLVIKNLAIEAANRGTAKLLVTWTVRVEGEAIAPSGCEFQKTGGYDVWKCICKPKGMNWHGETTQVFKGGQVKSRLFINGKDTENEASLTLPDAIASAVTQIYDPTITGSFLLTKDFFGGAFPKKIDRIEVKWYNDTSLRIKSPANQRSLIIKIMPVTASN